MRLIVQRLPLSQDRYQLFLQGRQRVELVQMLQHEFTPLEIDEESMAFGAHEEVGHGGHFLGAMHTMERFRTCFYRPMLSSSDNYEKWMRNGGHDANDRAGDR